MLVLLGCGLAELALRQRQASGTRAIAVLPLLVTQAARTAGPARSPDPADDREADAAVID